MAGKIEKKTLNSSDKNETRVRLKKKYTTFNIKS